VKSIRRDLPQRVLGQQRYLRPNLGIVEPLGIDAGKSVAKEWRSTRLLEGVPLAGALNPVDFRP